MKSTRSQYGSKKSKPHPQKKKEKSVNRSKTSTSQSQSQLQAQNDEYSPSGIFDIGKYKTKLCRHWKTGYCLFGPSCVFAHGVDDLCEPNLLISQMGNLMLVPMSVQGYGTQGSYSNEAGISTSSNSSLSNGMTMPLPMLHYQSHSIPLFQIPNTLDSLNQPTFGNSPLFNQGKESSGTVCSICSEKLDSSSKPRAFLPCMHEFHTGCLQSSEKIILESGCPSCISSSKSQLQPQQKPLVVTAQ